MTGFPSRLRSPRFLALAALLALVLAGAVVGHVYRAEFDSLMARIYDEVVEPYKTTRLPRRLLFWTDRSHAPVDLRRYFNNDGIAGPDNPSDTNFDCPDHPPRVPGSGYPARHLPDGGSVTTAGETPFLFPVVADEEMNNVACHGQRVSDLRLPNIDGVTPPCLQLALLAAAENGDASTQIGLEYDDGDVVRVDLAVPDWCSKPADGETVFASAPFRYALKGGTLRNVQEKIACHIFVRRIPVDPSRTLTAIILPEQHNLHVFAMTLRVTQPGPAVAWRGERLARHYRRVASLAHAPLADLDAPISELEAELEAARAELDPRFRRQWVWLKTQEEFIAYRAGRGIVRSGSQTDRELRNDAAGIRADLKTLLAGRDPFARRRGHILKGYRSGIDDTIQPYALYVPQDVRKTEPRPLVVHMHGHGWYRPFQGSTAPTVRDAIVLSPHGRGSMDYMFVAEEDVLACIDEVMKDYAIDPNRVYLMGHSMGGTGSWNLATKFPDRFAAIGPSAANADSKAWAKVGAKHQADPGRYAPLRQHIRDTLDPVEYAPNLLHVPAFVMHGEKDRVVPVGNSRSMVRALEKHGCPHVYREGRGGGHGWRPRSIVVDMHDYVLSKVRDPNPPRVRIRAAYLKYGRAYWLRITRFERRDRFAEIDAEVRGPSVLSMTAQNVAECELDLGRCPIDASKAITVAINRQPVYTDIPPPDGLLRLAKAGSGWRPASDPTGLRKRPYLEGPVSDAFTSSFLLVIGTQSAKPLDERIIREEAERFAADWERMYVKPPRLKIDRAVTDADIRRHNLILYGGPQDNLIAAKIADRTPLVFENAAVRIGARRYAGNGVVAKFCYPNPLNPDRLVVIIAGVARGRDLFQTNNLFGNWFQWGPFDNRVWFDYAVFDRRTCSAETCLEFGLFDDAWQIDERTRWSGVQADREASPLRRIPTHSKPPADKTIVYLSDLAPSEIDQHKLPVGFDTSAEGRTLSIGLPAKMFRRGLGVRPPSKIAFLVHPPGTPKAGRFQRFRVTVGIDIEGETVVPKWRKEKEWVKFLVYGDGRLLYQTGMLRWNSRPVKLDVPIARVRQLELQTWCTSARWLVGSAAWGNARVTRPEPKPPAAVGRSDSQAGRQGEDPLDVDQ
jgi:acetyl esterase/lipase